MSGKICSHPFQKTIINQYGDVSFCSVLADELIFYGNIYQKSFDEIWNGKKAQKIRKDIIDNKFEICNNCTQNERNKEYLINTPHSLIADYPKYITLCIDNSCECKCVHCRDRFKRLSERKQQKLEAMIDTTFIPMLKNAEILELDSDGEVFSSKIDLAFIKKAAKIYPNLKFDFTTNGINCNQKNLTELGITERIVNLAISLNAINQDTYDKFYRGGNLEKTLNNIKEINQLHKEKKIQSFCLTFCVTPVNFRDLSQMAKFAIKNKISLVLINFCDWGKETKLCRDFAQNNILSSHHPKNKELMKILQQDEFFHPYIKMSDEIRNVQEEFLWPEDQ